MRINEIIDTIHTSHTSSAPFSMHKMKDFRYKTKAEKAGKNGEYAYGSENPDDPHEFRKKTFLPSNLSLDAYYQFVKAAGPYMKSNPFLPRVYVVDIETDNTGKTVPQYNIETLKHASEYTGRALASIGRSIFTDFDVASYIDQDETGTNSTMVWAALVKRLNSTIYTYIRTGKVLPDIINKKFVEAMQIIKDVVNSNEEFDTDLHQGNYMIRGTPVGPQLVFADPVSDSGVSIVGGKPW